jgi:SMC interacting uncharacterized protein involved in chromosome segregation
MDWSSVGKWIVDAGGFAGIVALVALVVDSIRKSKALKIAKAEADSKIEIAKDNADAERVITREMGSKAHNESDEVIVRAADKLVYTMQRRLDALNDRLILMENEAKIKREELGKLYTRIGVMELALVNKEAALVKRDLRISELECQVKTQEDEIKRLKTQVHILELARETP